MTELPMGEMPTGELEPPALQMSAAPGTLRRRRAPIGSLVGWGVFIGLTALFLVFRPVAAGGFTSYTFVVGTSMLPTLHTGDLAIVIPQPAYGVGDIVGFHPSADPAGSILHRVVGGDAVGGFATKGDNRTDADPDRTPAARIVGKAVLLVPGGGLLLNALRSPGVLGALGALLTALVAWRWLDDREARRKRRPRADTR